MIRFPALLPALASAALSVLLSAQAGASDRALPMRFELRHPDPNTCGHQCQPWIAASGAITADTPQVFTNFVQGRDLHDLTVALDSDGGSVLGAIGLGREIRKLDLNTTVGRSVDLSIGDRRAPFAELSPRADCQSMCAFVLLAGVHRMVPPQARVMVHQIWLGDRREDPTAANYSAEDLVLVQHDIGSLAQYTVEMGASIDLLDLSLRIPPWEPMHLLSGNEIKRMHVATDLAPPPAAATVAASPPAAMAPPQLLPSTNAVKPTAISERRWAMVENAGVTKLARRHPLTIEGDEIGSFDLSVACGGSDNYDVSYVERRHALEQYPLPDAVSGVNVSAAGKSAPLKVVSSRRDGARGELVTFATGTVPSALITSFAAIGNHSLMVATSSAGASTGIRLGNTGAMQNLPRLAASCANKALGDRADLSASKIGGLAAAK